MKFFIIKVVKLAIRERGVLVFFSASAKKCIFEKTCWTLQKILRPFQRITFHQYSIAKTMCTLSLHFTIMHYFELAQNWQNVKTCKESGYFCKACYAVFFLSCRSQQPLAQLYGHSSLENHHYNLCIFIMNNTVRFDLLVFLLLFLHYFFNLFSCLF